MGPRCDHAWAAWCRGQKSHHVQGVGHEASSQDRRSSSTWLARQAATAALLVASSASLFAAAASASPAAVSVASAAVLAAYSGSVGAAHASAPQPFDHICVKCACMTVYVHAQAIGAGASNRHAQKEVSNSMMPDRTSPTVTASLAQCACAHGPAEGPQGVQYSHLGFRGVGGPRAVGKQP